MPKKTDISFILDEVDAQVRKNPNGLVSKPFAYKLENYLRKFINTRGDKAKSIISNLIYIQVNNKPYKLTTLYSSMLTMAEFSNSSIKVGK
jgi:hypothetical protein|tara:strand:+ start:758 stop:1030 length:273 start_codon:yes stop_codon:yes gene_type:complete